MTNASQAYPGRARPNSSGRIAPPVGRRWETGGGDPRHPVRGMRPRSAGTTSKLGHMGTEVQRHRVPKPPKSVLMRIGVGLFTLGLLAIVVVFFLFAFGFS